MSKMYKISFNGTLVVEADSLDEAFEEAETELIGDHAKDMILEDEREIFN